MTDIVSPPTINALPPAPQPADTPAEFDSKAFALLAAQVAMVGDFNSAAAATQQNATAANERAVAAASSASAANGSASTASTKAGVASGAATTAIDKAAEATASALSASKLNLGPKAVAPVVDNQGAALLAGATYYDTALGRWRVWSGAVWGDGVSVGSGVVAAQINAATAKATPADADELGITDSAASWGLKKLTFANLKAWIGSSLGGAGISNTPSGNIQATNVQAAINELDSEKVSKTGDNIAGNLNVSGSILSTGGAIGYSTGAGGTVTQATSKTTGVTINKPSGRITMHNAALAAGASVAFSVSNSTVAGHGVVVSGDYGLVNPSNYRIELAYSGAGSFAIRVTNITAGSLSQALEINFCVLARSFT